MERLIRQTLETLTQLGDSERIIIIKITDNTSGVVTAGLNKGEFFLSSEPVQLKNSPLEQVISTKQPRTFPCTLMESLPFPTDKNKNTCCGCLCLPLTDKNEELIGIAILAQKPGIPLPPERLQTLNTLRTLIATIITTSAENNQLLQLATVDSLTGLFTRHYFENRLQEEFTRIRRHGGVISLLVIDVDHFKQINDHFGYQEGNRILQKIARIIQTSIRKEIDIPCRYNGEQFSVLLPNTDVDGTYVLAERIRQRCLQHNFTSLKGLPLKVSVSAGIAHSVDIAHDELEDEDSIAQLNKVNHVSKEELLHRADMMLYAAKQAGRNQIMVWW